MPEIRFSCPTCKQSIVVDARGAGWRVSCPTCQKQIEIPRLNFYVTDTDDIDRETLSRCYEVIRGAGKASVSLLQRRLRLSYSEGVAAMEQFEELGIVGPSKGAEPRDILVDLDGCDLKTFGSYNELEKPLKASLFSFKLSEVFSDASQERAYSETMVPVIAFLCEGRADEAVILADVPAVATDRANIKELLHLILDYARVCLIDHQITEGESRNIERLKLMFRVQEGDFYDYLRREVTAILALEIDWILADLRIDDEEERDLVAMQRLFNLSYDHFIELCRPSASEFVLQFAAHASDSPEFQQNFDRIRRVFLFPELPTPKKAKRRDGQPGRYVNRACKELVWERDKGRCRACDSEQELEYDHIIPFSKGGSNTPRNIQLLCGPCNRKKSNTLGY
jgi:hypothetical protein